MSVEALLSEAEPNSIVLTDTSENAIEDVLKDLTKRCNRRYEGDTSRAINPDEERSERYLCQY